MIKDLKSGDKVYLFNTLSYEIKEEIIEDIEESNGEWYFEIKGNTIPVLQYCREELDGNRLAKYIQDWDSEELLATIYIYQDKEAATTDCNSMAMKKIKSIQENIYSNEQFLL